TAGAVTGVPGELDVGELREQRDHRPRDGVVALIRLSLVTAWTLTHCSAPAWRTSCNCTRNSTPMRDGAALRSTVRQKPSPLRRNASQATSPLAINAMPFVGDGPGLPSGLMKRVLPVGKHSRSACGRTSS